MTNSIFKVQVSSLVFPGFYNTDFDYDNFYGNPDDSTETYQEFQERILYNIVSHYREVLPEEIKIIEHKLFSPKEYNYLNDELYLIIECSYEDILFFFFSFESENLIDYVNFNNYNNNDYHEALLETFLEFIPFTGKYKDLYETTLHEKFLYD